MPKPTTIVEPGVITVTGSYLTKAREDRVQILFVIFGIIGSCLLFGPIGVVVGFFGAWIASIAWYWWLFPARLTFRFTADTVEVQGQPYSRAVPIGFTNSPMAVMGIAYSDGSESPEPYKAAKVLRMIYGNNEFVIAECRRPRHASDFVMACTSALSRTQGFAAQQPELQGRYTVTQLYDRPLPSHAQPALWGPPAAQSLPPPGTVRRRLW